MSTYGRVLRDRLARALFFSQAVSGLGDWIGLAALIVIAYQRSGSPLGSAAIFAVQGGSAMAATILIGPRLDAVDRRRGLQTLYLLGATALSLPLLVPTGLWPVLAAVGLVAAIRPLAAAMRNAVIGTLEGSLIGPSVALQSSVGQATATLGLLAGGTAAVTLGTRPALIIDVLTFVLAAAIARPIPRGAGDVRARPRTLDGVRAWMASGRARRIMRLVVVGATIGALPETMAPVAAEGSVWLPAVLSAQAAGTAIGGFVLGARPALETERTVVLLGLATAATLGIGATVANGHPGLLAAANLLMGIAFGYSVIAQTVFTKSVDPGRLGAAVSSAITIVMAAEGAGSLALGALATATSVAWAYVAGAMVLVVGFTSAVIRTPDLVRPSRTTEGLGAR